MYRPLTMIRSVMLAGVFAAGSAFAQGDAGAPMAAGASGASGGKGFLSRSWTMLRYEADQIWGRGKEGLYLPFYTHHGRDSYSPEKLETLNEVTWGLGYHRTLKDGRGNYRGLFLMGLSDSHRDLQLQAGYTYEWAWPVYRTLELRMGWSAMMIRRTDMFGGVPFPAVLPLFGLGNRELDLKMTYIPRISENMGNGDVLFMMMSYSF